jgi:hypothetical protein
VLGWTKFCGETSDILYICVAEQSTWYTLRKCDYSLCFSGWILIQNICQTFTWASGSVDTLVRASHIWRYLSTKLEFCNEGVSTGLELWFIICSLWMLCIAIYSAWPELGHELNFIQPFWNPEDLRCCRPSFIILSISLCLQIHEWSCSLHHLYKSNTENNYPGLTSAASLNSLLVSEIVNYPWVNKKSTHTHTHTY